MLQFRSEFSKSDKIFIPRLKIWIIILAILSAGHFFRSFKFINFNILAFALISLSIIVSFIPIFFKESKRKNFYYGIFLCFFDPICVSLFVYFSDAYHHVFLFLYILSLLFSGLLLSRLGVIIITFYNALLFQLVIYFSNFPIGQTFKVAVIITFFVFTLSIIRIKDYFNNIIRYLRVKDKNISLLEFFNLYLVNNMQNGLITVNENFIISFWNMAASDILRKNYKDVIGKDIRDVAPEIARYCVDNISDHVEIDYELEGKINNISLKVSPIKIEKEYVGNIIVLEDITEFIENQRVNRQNEKLAAIGRLVAALAHEIRNPLASISGSVEMLKECRENDDDRDKLMEIILREISSLNILICELLDFVKPIKLKQSEFNLSELIKDTIDLIRFEKKIQIESYLDEKLNYFGDKNKMKQVLLNILKNAVEILDEETGIIRVFLKESNKNVSQIIIEDNGRGIAQENLEKIFEPFFTTKEKGTGLGLATCQNILIMHGATVKAERKEGKTSFIITL